MNNNLFRKKSIDKISSPEELNDYLQITKPSTWVILIAILIILVGGIYWALVGQVEVDVDAAVICKKNDVTLYVSEQKRAKIAPGQEVRIDGGKYKVTEVINSPVAASDENGFDDFAIKAAGVEEGAFLIPVKISEFDRPKGNYEAKIVVEKIDPITFLFG